MLNATDLFVWYSMKFMQNFGKYFGTLDGWNELADSVLKSIHTENALAKTSKDVQAFT